MISPHYSQVITFYQEMAWSDIPWSDPRWLDPRPLMYNAAENAEVRWM